MENDRALYALGIHVLRHDAGRTLYGIDGGRGQIEDYGLYPGVSLQFNDIRCERLPLEEGVSSLLEMNYCAAGRYECEFRQGSCVRLQEGGFCACLRCACKVSSCFPTGRYRGISIMLDVKQAQRFMDGHYPELALALWQLPRRLCPNNACFLAQTEGALRQVFEQIAAAPPSLGIAYYRVKVLELFTLLCAWSPTQKPGGRYFTRDKTELLRHIREQIRQELSKEITLEGLAREHGLGMTALKRDFTALYGMSPFAYRRRCRMNRAAQLLADTQLPVMQIAMDVGYRNASKFSAAFREEMGVTPLAYRKKAERFGASAMGRDGLE
ncbi:MAG: AraC family transcriptional regulator [Clostridiales bacterium]|nr:AraC family transcriptional regulator [Clostridiales bacterium]MDO4351369.1 AraC family transcriptional regulator [Eubacteriales bacterium]MDY4008693.1 AraC family transcriptional regulator [Candidatus Limiplasma sp.]